MLLLSQTAMVPAQAATGHPALQAADKSARKPTTNMDSDARMLTLQLRQTLEIKAHTLLAAAHKPTHPDTLTDFHYHLESAQPDQQNGQTSDGLSKVTTPQKTQP